jgi:lysophospholipase L1-like esterase
MHIRKVLFLGSVAVCLFVAPTALASPPLPNSIAGIGDSITRATDVCCWYGDHSSHSWSTGGGAFDGITSHYEHILALKPSIYGHNYNDARAGAKMRDAQAQAEAAVTQKARYVTILMGANDACTSSVATMTSVSDFQSEFAATMNTLATGLPSGSHVFVSSIPNLYRLWQILHDNLAAELVWTSAGICQSLLSPYDTEADRQAVLAREEACNQVLQAVCSHYFVCRFDDYAVFQYDFTPSQVSKLDYFHPNLSGQAALASVTWAHSWWGS